MPKVNVQGNEVSTVIINKQDYISITDIAKHRNPEAPADIIKNWLRSKSTIEFIGLWEHLNNPRFKLVEFDQFRNEAGANHFVLSPKKWIEETNAVGIVSKSGKYGGTYAHKDIAFEFASWISPIFKLYLIKEFQRLKEAEKEKLGWDIKRNLAAINYHIHTDAIKNNLIPKKLSGKEISFVYASEADLLNMALFGTTAKEWREQNPDKTGNIRDFANASQLVCLSNLENLNALFIKEGLSQNERLKKLNEIAIEQMRILMNVKFKEIE
ncbi:MAG: KilA-N domain-containing protein [Leptospiraceae bacterium]|nr:KilA-N domain-containing protein [Leptospiraceae bacterium]